MVNWAPLSTVAGLRSSIARKWSEAVSHRRAERHARHPRDQRGMNLRMGEAHTRGADACVPSVSPGARALRDVPQVLWAMSTPKSIRGACASTNEHSDFRDTPPPTQGGAGGTAHTARCAHTLPVRAQDTGAPSPSAPEQRPWGQPASSGPYGEIAGPPAACGSCPGCITSQIYLRSWLGG